MLRWLRKYLSNRRHDKVRKAFKRSGITKEDIDYMVQDIRNGKLK